MMSMEPVNGSGASGGHISLLNVKTYVEKVGGEDGDETLQQRLTYDYSALYQVREAYISGYDVLGNPEIAYRLVDRSSSGSGNYTCAPELHKNRVNVNGTDLAEGIYLVGVGVPSNISALGGDDVIDLSQNVSGNAVIEGGDGNDTIRGGSGANEIYGGAGDDILIGGLENDLLRGGDGIDHMWGRAGCDDMAGGEGNDWVYGEDDQDLLSGDGHVDHIYGGAGDDILDGGEGDDYLYGDGGSDYIFVLAGMMWSRAAPRVIS